MTSSNGNICRVTGPLCGEFTGPGEFPTQRPVTRSFDAFFDVRLIRRLSKHSRGWWFETLSHPLWRHRNEGAGASAVMLLSIYIVLLQYQLCVRNPFKLLHFSDTMKRNYCCHSSSAYKKSFVNALFCKFERCIINLNYGNTVLIYCQTNSREMPTKRTCTQLLLWSAECIVNKSIIKFHWMSNSIAISLVGRVPAGH